MYRRASFIWTRSQQIDEEVSFATLLRNGPRRRETGANRWFLFRRRLSLPAAPAHATGGITADGRYKLWVNGELAGRGPVRSTPTHQRYDCIDLAPWLQEGPNLIGILVHVYGVDVAWYEYARDYWQTVFGDGALWMQIDAECERRTVPIDTDESWKCIECTAWNRDTPRAGWGQDFIEDFDARLFPAGWTAPDFDDSGWDRVRVLRHEMPAANRAIGFSAIEPFPLLVPSELPPLQEKVVRPSSVVATYKVTPLPTSPIDRRLYDESLAALGDNQTGGAEDEAPRVDNPNGLLDPGTEPALITTGADRDVSILVKFDTRHAGFPWIDLEAAGGEVVEVAVAETVPGEYPLPDGTGPTGPSRVARATHLDCALLYRYTAKAGRQRFDKFDWTTVKYCQITIRNAPKGVKVHGIGTTAMRYPVTDRQPFTCSDPFLSRLWRVGRYTLLMSTFDSWVDGPNREKRQWIGDGIVHQAVAAVTYEPDTIAVDRQFFLHGLESQRTDGLVQMFTPGDNHRDGITIPDFTLHWICGAHDFLMQTGEVETMAHLWPGLERGLAWFELHRDDAGLLSHIPYWHFIEWADVERAGTTAAINALYVLALRNAAEVAHYIGYEAATTRYRERAEAIALALQDRFWDAERGAYTDSLEPRPGESHPRISQQTNALFVVAGIAPPERFASMVAVMTDSSRLKLTFAPPMVTHVEPFDAASDVVRANTYFSHFVYLALAKMGRFDLVLEQIRRFYGPMMESGTETLWENFHPTASLCHAFSTTPVYQLSRFALGVEPLQPGFERFRLAPQPGDLTHAAGVYPTMRGDIEVEWERDEKSFTVTIAVPEGAHCFPEAPAGFTLPDWPAAGLESGTHRITMTRS